MQNGLHKLTIFYFSDVLFFPPHIFSITDNVSTGHFIEGGEKPHKSNNIIVFFYKNEVAKKSWEAARLFSQLSKRPSQQ